MTANKRQHSDRPHIHIYIYIMIPHTCIHIQINIHAHTHGTIKHIRSMMRTSAPKGVEALLMPMPVGLGYWSYACMRLLGVASPLNGCLYGSIAIYVGRGE